MRNIFFVLSGLLAMVLNGCSSPPPPRIPLYPVQVKVKTGNPVSPADLRLIKHAFRSDFWLTDDQWSMIKLDFPAMELEKVGAPTVDCGEVKMVIWRGDYQTLSDQEFFPEMHLSDDDKRITGSLNGVNYTLHFRVFTAYNLRVQSGPKTPAAPPDIYYQDEDEEEEEEEERPWLPEIPGERD